MSIFSDDTSLLGMQIDISIRIYFMSDTGIEDLLLEVDSFSIIFGASCSNAILEAQSDKSISIEYDSTPYEEPHPDASDSTGTLTGSFYYCGSRQYTATLSDGSTQVPDWFSIASYQYAEEMIFGIDVSSEPESVIGASHTFLIRVDLVDHLDSVAPITFEVTVNILCP